MESNLRTLGANEARVLLTFLEEGRQVVSAREILPLLGDERKGRKVIETLIRKGWLVRLGGGKYIILPPDRGPENYGENNALALASASVTPSYVGWWSAAAFHGLTTQRPSIVTMATRKDVAPRSIEGTQVKFIKLPEYEFFGFNAYTIFGREARISTIEKTVVDCADRPRLCGGATELARIVYGAKRSADQRNLVQTALRMRSVSLLQRLGFLTDLVGWMLQEKLRDELRLNIPSSARSTFGRDSKNDHDIGYVHQWGLFVNISSQRLLADVPQEGLGPN